MRYFVYFSYKGTHYHGWQRQNNAVTVQQTMEEAFSIIFRAPISLTGAGRTDTGVHAKMMTAHFDTDADILSHAEQLTSRLNNFLPRDITIQRIVPVKADAHARFDALSRTYQYFCTEEKSTFFPELVTRIPKGLDFEEMNRAARILLTTDDFASFCKLHTDVKTTLCKVSEAEWKRQDEYYVFTIRANRFLRNMVRAIVGTLLDVGRGKMDVDEFQHIISLKKREAASQSAPSEGLYLVDVEYPESLFF